MFTCRGSAEALLEDNREWESSSPTISSLLEKYFSLSILGNEFITSIKHTSCHYNKPKILHWDQISLHCNVTRICVVCAPYGVLPTSIRMNLQLIQIFSYLRLVGALSSEWEQRNWRSPNYLEVWGGISGVQGILLHFSYVGGHESKTWQRRWLRSR